MDCMVLFIISIMVCISDSVARKPCSASMARKCSNVIFSVDSTLFASTMDPKLASVWIALDFSSSMLPANPIIDKRVLFSPSTSMSRAATTIVPLTVETRGCINAWPVLCAGSAQHNKAIVILAYIQCLRTYTLKSVVATKITAGQKNGGA